MQVSLAVLAAFVASYPHNDLLVAAFQPSRDLNRQSPNAEQQQQQQDRNHPRQSTRLNDASAMPYLSNWKLLPEGNIQGVIFGHPFLENGDVVTTSQIKGLENASENQIIETESGSQYLLRDRDAEQQMASETRNTFNNNVAGPLLGGAVFAAGAAGLAMDGEGVRFDAAGPVQVLNEMSAVSLNQFQNSAKSLPDFIDMPYLASKVSEAEKQFQAARENLFKQKGPESNVAASTVIAKQDGAQPIQQALSVAAEKVAVEKAALYEKVAWENFVNMEIAKEKAETEAMKRASSAAAKALSENNLDEARAAMERAQLAKAAVAELQAERQSATLAEESAEAEELFAEQDVMKVIKEIRQMATMYSAKAAGLKPADALYYLEELRINPKLAEYMNTPERQVALGSLAAAAATGTALAGISRSAKKVDDEEVVASAVPMASASSKKWENAVASASLMASSTTEKVVPQPSPVAAAPKPATTPTSITTSNTAGDSTKSNWGSYLDVLGSYGSGSSVVSSSYSPFGKKATGMTSHTSLYAAPGAKYVPPVAAAVSSKTAPATAATTPTPPPNTTSPAQEQARAMGGSSSGYLDALSGKAGAAILSSYSPYAPNKSSAPPQNKSDIPAHVRLAYNEWCEYYGKKNEESRLEIFAQNFADAKEFYKESGRALLLNEYADLTASEYKLLSNTALIESVS